MFRKILWSLVLGVGMTSACRSPEVHAMQNRIDHGEVISVLEISRRSLPSGPDHTFEATFTIQRSGVQPLELTFGSGQQYDLIIEEPDGTERWRWSEGRFFTQAVVSRTLTEDPLVYREEIPTVDRVGEPLVPGVYVLRARLTAVQYEVENSVEFQIEGD